jgi:hypothetical protein
VFFLLVGLFALVVAVARRLSLRDLAETRFAGLGALTIAVLLRVILNPLVLPGDWAKSLAMPVTPGWPQVGGLMYIASFVFALLFLVANRAKPGFWLILVGLALNLAVITANGGQMPGNPAQLQRAGMIEATLEHLNGRWSPFGVAGPGTPLAFLGDVVFVPMPFREPTLVSIGDLVISLGVFAFVNRLSIRVRGRARAVVGE